MKILNKIKFIIPVAMLASPIIVFAGNNTTLGSVISLISSYLNSILALLMGLAVVFFVFYVVQYFLKPNDKRSEAAQYVMWSLIGFFVIFTFWGIVNIVIATFNLGPNNPGSWQSFINMFPSNN